MADPGEVEFPVKAEVTNLNELKEIATQMEADRKFVAEEAKFVKKATIFICILFVWNGAVAVFNWFYS